MTLEPADFPITEPESVHVADGVDPTTGDYWIVLAIGVDGYRVGYKLQPLAAVHLHGMIGEKLDGHADATEHDA